jgi:hypothetical protein
LKKISVARLGDNRTSLCNKSLFFFFFFFVFFFFAHTGKRYFYGEVDRVAAVSAQRFRGIEPVNASHAHLTLAGSAAEHVAVAFSAGSGEPAVIHAAIKLAIERKWRNTNDVLLSKKGSFFIFRLFHLQ